MNTKISIAVLALAGLSSTAFAAKPPSAAPSACSFSDLVGVTVTACSGFVEGNLLKGNAGDLVKSDVATQLGLLGLGNTSTFKYIEKIGSNNGGMTINFDTLLMGDTVIGLHLGGGSNKFSSNVPGGATAFYRFNANNSVDVLGLKDYMSASSGVAIFQTVTAVPEPGTYAMLLAGLAAVGFVARRRAAV